MSEDTGCFVDGVGLKFAFIDGKGLLNGSSLSLVVQFVEAYAKSGDYYANIIHHFVRDFTDRLIIVGGVSSVISTDISDEIINITTQSAELTLHKDTVVILPPNSRSQFIPALCEAFSRYFLHKFGVFAVVYNNTPSPHINVLDFKWTKNSPVRVVHEKDGYLTGFCGMLQFGTKNPEIISLSVKDTLSGLWVVDSEGVSSNDTFRFGIGNKYHVRSVGIPADRIPHVAGTSSFVPDRLKEFVETNREKLVAAGIECVMLHIVGVGVSHQVNL